MRFKTLGIVLVSAMALFTAFYWITDTARRDTRYEDQFAELLAYGEELFAPDNIIYDVTVSAAGFEPATIRIQVHATIQFISTLDSDVIVRGTGGHAFELAVKAGLKATTRFASDGATTVTADGTSGSLEVTAGPEVLNESAANCAACHGLDGRGGEVGNSGRIAPNLHSISIYDKLKAQAGGSFTAVRRPGDAPDYVNLVIRFGGVVVSGDVNSPMPAWSIEAGGPLTIHQVDALTALIETWVLETAALPVEEVPDTVEAGQQVYTDKGCGSCHGADLGGVIDSDGTVIYPSIQNIGSEPVTDLPRPITRLAELQADYAADARAFLERWIRDSAVNYNDGTPTGMPVHPEGTISPSAMRALITFLLDQKQ